MTMRLIVSADTFIATHLKVKHNSAGEVSITLPTNPNLDRPPPPDNSGSRTTTTLSRRGAKLFVALSIWPIEIMAAREPSSRLLLIQKQGKDWHLGKVL